MVQTASSTTVRKYNIITYYTRTQSASESNAIIEHFTFDHWNTSRSSIIYISIQASGKPNYGII